MRPEEVERAIVTSRYTRPGGVKIRAEFIITAEQVIDARNSPDIIKMEEEFCKKKLVEMIMRKLYDDQRSDMVEALQELQKVILPQVGCYSEFHEAMNKLMKLARRQ